MLLSDEEAVDQFISINSKLTNQNTISILIHIIKIIATFEKMGVARRKTRLCVLLD